MKKQIAAIATAIAALVSPAQAQQPTNAAATATVGVNGAYNLGGNSVNMGGNSIGLKASNEATQNLTGTLSQTGTLNQTGSTVAGDISIETKRNTPPVYASTPAIPLCGDNQNALGLTTQFFGIAFNGGTTSSVCKIARDAQAVSVVFNAAGDGGNVAIGYAVNNSSEVRDALDVAISIEKCVASGQSRLVCARDSYNGFNAAKQVKTATPAISYDR